MQNIPGKLIRVAVGPGGKHVAGVNRENHIFGRDGASSWGAVFGMSLLVFVLSSSVPCVVPTSLLGCCGGGGLGLCLSLLCSRACVCALLFVVVGGCALLLLFLWWWGGGALLVVCVLMRVCVCDTTVYVCVSPHWQVTSGSTSRGP